MADVAWMLEEDRKREAEDAEWEAANPEWVAEVEADEAAIEKEMESWTQAQIDGTESPPPFSKELQDQLNKKSKFAN